MLIGLAFTFAGLYIAFRKIDVSDLGEILSHANVMWILLGAGLLVFSVWLRAVRWRILLAPIKTVGLKPLFASTMIGYFGNSVLPLRLGELLRAYSIKKQEASVTTAGAFGTIVVERLLDMVANMMLMIIFFLLYDVPSWLEKAGVVLGFVVVGSSILLWWVTESHQEWLNRFENLALFQRGKGIRIKHLLHSFIEGLITLKSIPRYGLLVSISLLLWAIYLVITQLSAWALGISLTWVEVGVILVATTMVISLPSAPGFIGTYHAAAVLIMAEIFGKPEPASQAYAILNHAIAFVPLVVIGLFYFLRVSITVEEIKGLKIKA